MFLRFHLFRDDLPTKSENVRSKVSRFFYEVRQVQEFSVVNLVVELTPRYRDELLALHRARIEKPVGAYDISLNTLVSELLPQTVPGRIDEFSQHRAVRHVLYLEPSQVIPIVECGVDHSERVVQALREQFEYAQIPETSVTMQDVLLFPGLGYGNRSLSYLAIRPKPLKADRMIQIPLIPMSLLGDIAANTIKSICANELDALNTSRDAYWETLKNGDFDSYRLTHLKNRLNSENRLLKAHELSALINEKLPCPLIYRDDYTTHWCAPLGSDTQLRMHSIGDGILRYKAQVDGLLSAAIQSATKRLEVLDNFARDSALADSTASSLVLAKSVRFLTWVVVLVALLTLAASLIPDVTKERIVGRIVQGHSEWGWILDRTKGDSVKHEH